MSSLPWFSDNKFPLYLAPMAGVTDVVFRSICKELGADVMVTEFVSAEGIIRQDDRTRKYTEFTDGQRPCGVQLFGGDGERMGEAAKKIIDWKQPDFIDINFGCPVNKVVAKNGGSSLLKCCDSLASVASGVAKAVGDQVPVTAKIRIGWDEKNINAPEVCRILQEEGMQAISIHGRTRAQGYRGEANWDVIDACAREVSVPVVGNGDICSGEDVKLRRETTAVSGVMIGRAAMQNPWVFREAKHYLTTGEHPEPVAVTERWKMIIRHCSMAMESDRYGNERQTIMAMRSRLMTYCKGFPGAKPLRQRLCTVSSLQEVKDVAAEYLQELCEA
ncbi:tRNA dihydrouridine synthase DusB [Verrucomicrobiaceae bacterium 5K15]|uniref:tRNA-dihydrouridine synthase n=1 Tax=Oceaniferula flava TaxID=2800421 RepID=A0AAE2VCV8_9BACT|nr:tRNA dihydrouridine synthase DusB [Oceaniferula flavus]MBK1856080.1 tRNA dihydrouridine synthase DusB [Oceaniferula flavus]MBM1137387.1 tRNA dihydrouridine synthase DusB [Oceaniferula flavus]